MKYVIFDLDETLGHFHQLSTMDWVLKKFYNRELTKKEFFKIIDLFQNIIRPNILFILKYLKKIKSKKNIKIVIYTNNTGKKMWVHRIKSYLEYKLKGPLFDRVICGWKYDKVIMEPKRTSWNKSYKDVKNILHLRRNDTLMFIDDQTHPDMFHKNIHYVKIDPYVYKYDANYMLKKFISANNFKNTRIKKLLEISQFFVNERKNCNDKYDTGHIKRFTIHGKRLERIIKKFCDNADIENQVVKKIKKVNTKKKKKLKLKNKTAKLK